MPFCQITLKAQKPKDPAYPEALTTIGDHLRKRRLDLKLKAGDVAVWFGVDRDTVYAWEYNRHGPSKKRFSKVIEFLGYKPEASIGRFFGQELIAYRKVHGLTQMEFAKYLGVHKITLLSWEKNRSRPSDTKCAKILRFLNSVSLNLELKKEKIDI